METADEHEVGVREALEEVQAACRELARLKGVDEIAELAMTHALALTRSSVAFMGLTDDAGSYERVYSRAADTSRTSMPDEAQRLIAGETSSSNPVVSARLLEAAGEHLGMIGVARELPYTQVHRNILAILASQVAASVQIAFLRGRRQEMVDTLINVRSDLERTEKERLISAERAKSAARVEKAHELSVEALLAISVHARSGYDLTEFYQRLGESVAALVGAEKVLFWQVTEDGTLSAVRGGYGVDDTYVASLRALECGPDRDDLQSNVVYKDYTYIAAQGDGGPETNMVLGALGVKDAMSVPWRAGDQRLGLLAAYDSIRPEGFSREDAWVLQNAGLAAGLVRQLKTAEADLHETVERLQKVDAARLMLLKTVSTAVDNERKRFANQLHDDALQKLTAAELQLQRVGDGARPNVPALGEAQSLLGQTEDALRRLLFEVRPPALEDPEGLTESIRDRLAMFRSLTGIEAELELDLPEGLSYEFKSTIFRQVAEALTNIEKHARATRVQLRVTASDSGVHGLVVDNGKGFMVAERNNLPGHLGLLALKERALMAGGWYKIESRPGLGTTIEFWMPIT
ncbi:MAG TPA: GAF domain-containing sensor histidine kinase [Candidatus Dormibacteraeota bacterium]|nr:GAF domain-containing sensor histidine kinase [Candidatus Dormibacteraeota bacterium]